MDIFEKYKGFVSYCQNIGPSLSYTWSENIKEFDIIDVAYIYDDCDYKHNVIRIYCRYLDKGFLTVKKLEYYQKTYDEYNIEVRDYKLEDLGI